MWLKTILDYTFSLILLLILVGLIFLLIIIASIDTGKFGIFTQDRIGKDGKPFKIYKVRSIREKIHVSRIELKITKFGKFIRYYKLDELPQLFNVLIGDMSFVGPRPDVPGYADKLVGNDRIILKVKPGITGPAQIKFRNEEELLSKQKNPIQFNDNVLWAEKVKINVKYVKEWSIKKDLYYLYKTIF